MDVSAVNNININNTGANPIGGNTLGKNDFLKLLITQLSRQDPLNPMDSVEFTAQLTQFSSLEELNNVNSTLTEMLASQQSLQNAMVTDMIGKVVKTFGNETYLTDTADISYALSGDAASVKVSIFDRSGNLVFSEDVGTQAAGDNSYVWDGKDFSGDQMIKGAYTFEIDARDASGESISALTRTTATVTGVAFEDGVTYLVLDGYMTIHLSEILSVEQGRN